MIGFHACAGARTKARRRVSGIRVDRSIGHGRVKVRLVSEMAGAILPARHACVGFGTHDE